MPTQVPSIPGLKLRSFISVSHLLSFYLRKIRFFLFAKVFWRKQVETYLDRYLKLKSVSKSGMSSISYMSYCWWFKHLANQFSIPAAFSPSTVASIIVQYLLQLGLCIMDTEVKSSFCNMEVRSNVKALAILGGGGATPKNYTRL